MLRRHSNELYHRSSLLLWHSVLCRHTEEHISLKSPVGQGLAIYSPWARFGPQSHWIQPVDVGLWQRSVAFSGGGHRLRALPPWYQGDKCQLWVLSLSVVDACILHLPTGLWPRVGHNWKKWPRGRDKVSSPATGDRCGIIWPSGKSSPSP